MFHPYNKSSSYLRNAIFQSYGKKCVYCGCGLLQRNMHIDHILPSKLSDNCEEDVKEYVLELKKIGFVSDCIENYLPTCSSCNISKSNNVYSVSNLRYYHEMAKEHINDILSRIETQRKQSKETFYEPVDSSLWEEINFSFQRDLSHAIMGYRLSVNDVVACPRFPQVERIKKQLSVADYVVIQGEPGCGKSVSVYQAAYDYYKDGWKVYKLKNNDDIRNISINNNTEQSLYIVDDAQSLKENAINSLKGFARPNLKIIFAGTNSSEIQPDSILLTNQDSVEILYSDFLKRKKEIIPIVHTLDSSVGENFAEQPIEWRLEKAKKASTPWQFNYILRGGWQTMNEQYQSICLHNDCDLLAAIIATFQILKLDSPVNFSWLCNFVREINSSYAWDNNDLDFLINNRIVLSSYDTRIVHLESANFIVYNFIKSSSPEKVDLLKSIIHKAFMEDIISPLGIVWLSNGMTRYYDCSEKFLKSILDQEMIDHAFNNLGEVYSSTNRASIAFFIEKLFNSPYERNGKYYLGQNLDIICDWIENADSETAFSYSQIINISNNHDKPLLSKIRKKINWNTMTESLMKETDSDYYSWGCLFERLTNISDKRRYAHLSELMIPILDRISQQANLVNIVEITYYLSLTCHINPNYTHKTIRKLIPVYKELFKRDMIRAFEVFGSDFLMRICGMSFWGRHRITDEEKTTAKEFVAALPVRELSIAIANSSPMYWQTIDEILDLVETYDKKKAKVIVDSIDLSILSNNAENSWNDYYNITRLCLMLYYGSKKTAQKFIEMNLSNISVLFSPFLFITPKCSIDLYQKGISIDLLTGHWWHYSYFALKGIVNENPLISKDIIKTNICEIINRINTGTALNFESTYCLKFLQFIRDFDIELFKMISNGIDKNKISENWDRCGISKKGKQNADMCLQKFYNLMSETD